VPHATLAAVRAFDSVVLIAGGRNKGLDLTPLAEASDRVRAVIAIGEAANDVQRAFGDRVPVEAVKSNIDDAVAIADELAESGDVVLLSPGCASFDWFESYKQRGEAFRAAATRHFDRKKG
jgi:UDP-N-acetylmuramoylalanine--D-glutamate ligase